MRFLLVLFGGLTSAGCLTRTLPPPPTPDKTEPTLPDAPTEPPAGSSGRVVLDADGPPAKVSRVTETRIWGYGLGMRSGRGLAAVDRSVETLCITPCAVDLRQGAHMFVFEDRADPSRASLAEVVVTPGTTFVRHAIGREPKYSGGYVSGWVLMLPGAGLTLMGSLVTAVGAFAREPEPGSGATDGRSFLPVGLVLLGTGVALLTTGILLTATNRPEEQPGSTIQWKRRVVDGGP